MAKNTYDLDRYFHTKAGLGLISMMTALEPFTENEEIELGELDEPQPPQFWPSNIERIDINVGGFYGVSVLAAEKGTGKTMLALSSMIEATATGDWQGVHFLAEDDYDGFVTRFNAYLETHPGSEDCIPHLKIVAVGKGQTPMTLTHTISGMVNTDLDTPLLIGIDSLNSVVNLSGRAYLSALSEFGLWAMYSRRISRAAVSFLITTESNKRGESKGEQLPFWADVYLKMKKKRGNIVEMWLDKTRRTKGEGPLGKYYRVWHTGRFLHESALGDDEQPPQQYLRLVGGADVPAAGPSPDDEDLPF